MAGLTATKLTAQMSVKEILSTYPLAGEAFRKHGIKFIGNDASPLEPLEVVARKNGLSVQQISQLVEEMNSDLEEKSRALFSGELVKLTEAAAKELKGMLEKRPGKSIILRLASDGCGLYTYDMDFTSHKTAEDIDFVASGVPFLIRKKDVGYLKGTEISFTGEGFVFKNPNVSGSAAGSKA